MNCGIISTLIVSLAVSVWLPDAYLPGLLKLLRRKANIGEVDEDDTFRVLPKYLGWVERGLTWFVWFFLNSQFVTFMGVWFALKVVGGYEGWKNLGHINPAHRGRANFIIFAIGTATSFISVIVVAILTQFLLSPNFC